MPYDNHEWWPEKIVSKNQVQYEHDIFVLRPYFNDVSVTVKKI